VRKVASLQLSKSALLRPTSLLGDQIIPKKLVIALAREPVEKEKLHLQISPSTLPSPLSCKAASLKVSWNASY